MHHLDVPWLPSQIEQREGRIERQGNQHDEIGIYAYATLGSMDATMSQNNERKARFIEAALSGDRMEADLEEHRRRATDAKVRLAGYEPRLGEAFPLQGELDGKLGQLAEIEADLASTEGVVNENGSARPRAIAA
jgi:hypothetical protein